MAFELENVGIEREKSELLDMIIHAEKQNLSGKEKESLVVRKLIPKIVKRSGLGLVGRLIFRRFIPIILRAAIRAIIITLNDTLGKDWHDTLKGNVGRK